MTITCIIIEDEPLATERIKGYVKKIPFLHLLKSFENAIAAFAYLKENRVDLTFLDINLGEFSGIQLLESTKIGGKIIVTTAYHEYALKGYELNVTDYLLKPFTFERFLQAVDKVQSALTNEVEITKDYIFIKTENRLEKVNLNDILFIEGMRDYRRIHTTKNKIMTLQTFSELENEISSSVVCRVHKSYMVAINKIELIQQDEIKITSALIPISETYKKEFYSIIGRNNK
jgi:two-component system, LytTR family, response regulator